MGRDRRPARAGRTRLRLALLAAILVLLASACDGGAPESSPTSLAPTAASTPVITFAPSGDPGAVVEQLVLACKEKDAQLLRSFLAATVSDADIEALFARGDDVRLAQREPAEIDGDRATVDVRLEIQRGGKIEAVDRTWRLARGAGGVWRFSELPDCY